MPHSVELKHYLRRVGFEGTAKPDLATLVAIHRGHCDCISYENLDVQLGRAVPLDPVQAFRKIVEERRGGWCYEMNGLMGWALTEIGFRVTQLAGGAGRETAGDDALGTHLVLLVDLDRPYIADVGFGDGIVEPVPLATGCFSQRGFDFGLSDAGEGWWRFHNHPEGGAPSFDFRSEAAEPQMLQRKCTWLQSDPKSSFVLNAVCQRYRGDEHYSLRGRVLKTLHNGSVAKRTIRDEAEYAETLRMIFDIDLPEAVTLWPKITARHHALFGDDAS